MRLSLFVVDFHLEKSALEGMTAGQLPALAALESLLHQGRRLPTHPDWRTALLGELGLPTSPALSPARIAALALDPGPREGTWFAQPVHRVAGLNDVRLHSAGLLRLSPEEAADWSRDFNSEFQDSGLRLHSLPPGMLLTGLPGGTTGGVDPACLLGATLPTAMSPGGSGRPLRQASAEIEMWLHAHPRNRERERRGELPINGLWLWGGEGNPLRGDSALAAPLPDGFGNDPFLRGLWCALGSATREARQFADLPDDSSTAIVVQSAAAQSLRDHPLHRLEADWFAPAVDSLSGRKLRRLRLWMGGRGWEIAPSRFPGAGWRGVLPWRRSRPWWQQVTA